MTEEQIEKAYKAHVSEYELEAWLDQLGSVPVERIITEDFGGFYEIEQATVYRLENDQYAVVFESGCSCYEARNAEIDLFPNLDKAMESYNNWVKAHKRDEHDED